jgi:hypothetical protein
VSPNGGPIRVVVRSRRVPVALTEFGLPSYATHYGLAYSVKKRSIAYEYVLDEEETRIVEEVRQAAERSGLAVEVVDLGRAGPLSRLFRRLLERLAGGPKLLLSQNQVRCAPGLAC